MDSKSLTIFIRTPIGKMISLSCPLNWPIKSIKEFIKDHECINSTQYYLAYKSRCMTDENTLEDYNVQEHDTIFINIYMRGD